MSTGLVGVTYGLAEAGTYDSFTDPHVWVPIVVGAILIAVLRLPCAAGQEPAARSAPVPQLALLGCVDRDVHARRRRVRGDDPDAALLAGAARLQRDRDRPADRPAGPRHGDHDAAGREDDRALRRRSGRPGRRDRHRHHDDPVRPDRRPHQRRVPLRRDGLPRHGHGRQLHAGDDRRVRRTRAQRGQSRDAAAERGEPRRWLDRNDDSGRRARERSTQRAHPGAGCTGLRHSLLVVGRRWQRPRSSRASF